MVKNKLLNETGRQMSPVHGNFVNELKDATRVWVFMYLLFCPVDVCTQMIFIPICQDISLRSREIPHCQWGWTGSHPHSYFISADWASLPSLSPFSATKGARMHAHRPHSLLLLASCKAEMPSSKMYFFQTSSTATSGSMQL